MIPANSRLSSQVQHPARIVMASAVRGRGGDLDALACVVSLAVLGVGIAMALSPQPPRAADALLRTGGGLAEHFCGCVQGWRNSPGPQV